MGPRAVLDAVEKRKIPSPRRISNAIRPSRGIVTVLTEVPRSPVLQASKDVQLELKQVDKI
jgi:hypothetical protein